MSDENSTEILRSSSLPHRGLSAKSRQFTTTAHNRTTVRVDRANARALVVAQRELRQTRKEIRRPAFMVSKPVATKMLNQFQDYKPAKRINVSI